MKLAAALALLVPVFLGAGFAPPDDELPEGIDEVFAKYDLTDGVFGRRDAPGMTVAVIRDGKIVYEKGFGMASLENRVPNGPDTVFRIGSTSKQFTAVCLAILIHRGEVGLEDEITKYFPEMRTYDWPIRVRHLVHHTSGIRDYIEIHVRRNDTIRDHVELEDSIATIARQRSLEFEPGSKYSYSNSNYLLMGEIVHRVSGKTLAEFAQEFVFGPLGMENSRFVSHSRDVVPKRAWGYTPHGDGFRLDITDWDHVGDGSVFTTVRDLAKWDAHFYAPALEGGQALVDLQHQVEPLNDGTPSDYAFGLGVREHRGLRLVEHGGAWVGYRAQMMRFPDEKLTVIVLANRADVDPDGLCMAVVDLFLEERYAPREEKETKPAGERKKRPRPEKPERPPAPDQEAAAGYLGRYWNEDLACLHDVVWKKDRLRLARFGTDYWMRIMAPDTFRGAGMKIIFTRDETGAVTGFTAHAGSFGELWFERL